MLVGVGLYEWLTQYYFPVRDAVPIVNLLEKGDFRGAARLISGPLFLPNGEMVRLPDGRPKRDPNRIRIRGVGAERIKRAILNVLNDSSDIIVLRETFNCVILGTIEQNVLFDKQSECAILEKAVMRVNAKKTRGETDWSVGVSSNGWYYLNMSHLVID
jgi:hypothetical protein